jgi:hypothetical protein
MVSVKALDELTLADLSREVLRLAAAAGAGSHRGEEDDVVDNNNIPC